MEFLDLGFAARIWVCVEEPAGMMQRKDRRGEEGREECVIGSCYVRRTGGPSALSGGQNLRLN